MKEPEAFKQFDIYNRNDEDVRKEMYLLLLAIMSYLNK